MSDQFFVNREPLIGDVLADAGKGDNLYPSQLDPANYEHDRHDAYVLCNSPASVRVFDRIAQPLVAIYKLDLLVAEKVMGLPIIRPGKDGFFPFQGDHEWLNNRANYPYVTEAGGLLILWSAPNTDGQRWRPSEDIATAFLVVEHIRSRFDLWFEARRWRARFGVLSPVEEAETAPLAICGAALVYADGAEAMGR